MTKNIFDLKNTNDVPAEVLKSVSGRSYRGGVTAMYINLFELKNKLTLDEIVIALFRAYGITKKRSLIYSQVYYLVRKGILKRNIDGTYERIEQ